MEYEKMQWEEKFHKLEEETRELNDTLGKLTIQKRTLDMDYEKNRNELAETIEKKKILNRDYREQVYEIDELTRDLRNQKQETVIAQALGQDAE